MRCHYIRMSRVRYVYIYIEFVLKKRPSPIFNLWIILVRESEMSILIASRAGCLDKVGFEGDFGYSYSHGGAQSAFVRHSQRP